jgi:hypothetical protein
MKLDPPLNCGLVARVHLRNGTVQHFKLPPLRWPPDRVQYGGDEYALQPEPSLHRHSKHDTPGAPAIYKLTGGPFRLEPHWRCPPPQQEKAANQAQDIPPCPTA